ncbi:hypothetical protein LCGC14_0727960 [marine sediment metagenome]|uniref:Methyltransferase domain-containing protein n=1 Tax=marine sediment metagenome TaxID=412755 RepID=A0A0F9QEL4_9ZZZZ
MSFNLNQLYGFASMKKSNIYKHAAKLRDLASRCHVVTEFGVSGGISTTALLAGQPDKLVSYDLHPCPVVERLMALSGRTDFRFRQEDVLEAEPIGFTDFLFLDTRHTEDQAWSELSRHGHRVTRWLGFHDTTAFGERGQDGGRGIMYAIRRWMRDNPEWFATYHNRVNNGLLVLSRNPMDKRLCQTSL